eukprot:CAMPEP_0197901584 /NCGR_PEP_ID=MMETSP1439-20131203/51406_1 /TAXON_ID=66791 /ORGANISM="Gonyaulax spinifera, Strain CCMP409" /LENGTH=320 /DNA_ID=CAMNT_0043522561 /DNA_START=67 /DNA_END=1029 /DNA_ORIENTATION=+
MATASEISFKRQVSLQALTSLRKWLPGWEVDPQDLIVDTAEVLGAGSTSLVYPGALRGKPVAVKTLIVRDEDVQLMSTLEVFLRELELWPRMDHPNVLKFFGFGLVGDSLALCAECCGGGTLFNLLHNCWYMPLNWRRRRKILTDIASAVKYLHTNELPIMHRDLKSLNILLVEAVTADNDKDPEVRLCDFGFARSQRVGLGGDLSWSDELTQGAGTPHWMAPEVSTSGHYGESADVFSFSIVMYEVITRHMAFEDDDPETARIEISRGVRPVLDADMVPEDTPPALLELMAQCWDQDPAARPSFTAIHERLLELDWSGL